MTSTLKKNGKSKYELTVELNREELSEYVKLAESRISQEFKMDGFRKGKVPRDKIRQEVGDEAILQEALDYALKNSLAKAIDKDGLEVLKVSNLNVKENSAAKLLYTVDVMTFPEIKLASLEGVKLKIKEVSVERAEIENVLEEILVSRSVFEPKDKKVEKGDRVEIDFETTSEGLPIEGGLSKNHPLVVGDNKFIPGFEEAILGMKKDEEKTFSLNAPKDYFHKAVAGKKLDFKVKVILVQEVKKPALSDDFARSLGRFSDLKELENNISQGILEEKKNKEKQRLRLEILSAILAKSKVEIPDEMVEERLDEMVESFDNELHGKGLELAMYLTHLNKTQDNLRQDWRPEAEKQVSFALILQKIAKDHGIVALPDEVNTEAEKIIQAMAFRGEVDKENINLEAIKENVQRSILNEKVFSLLESRCLA